MGQRYSYLKSANCVDFIDLYKKGVQQQCTYRHAAARVRYHVHLPSLALRTHAYPSNPDLLGVASAVFKITFFRQYFL